MCWRCGVASLQKAGREMGQQCQGCVRAMRQGAPSPVRPQDCSPTKGKGGRRPGEEVVPISLPTPKSQAVLTSRPHRAQLGSTLQQWIPNPKSPAPGAHGVGNGTARILLTASRMTSPQDALTVLGTGNRNSSSTPSLPSLPCRERANKGPKSTKDSVPIPSSYYDGVLAAAQP